MAIINGIVGRFDKGDLRYYVDPADSDVVLDSVTTIIDSTESAPYLVRWSAKLAAQFSAENHEFLGQTIDTVGKAGAVDLIKGAAERARGLKADIGTHQHDILEALILDQPIPELPEHLVDVEVDGETVDHDAISDGLLNFLTDQNIEVEMAEATVANPELGYAGTLDLIVYFPKMRLPGKKKPGARGLIDLKTGAHLRSKIKKQLAAYRKSTEIWLDNMGNKAPMPEVDFCAVLHVRREHDRGYKFLEVEAGDVEFQRFMNSFTVYRDQQADKKLGGKALYKPLPDGTQPLPLLEDLDVEGFNRCKKALKDAGIRDLSDLSGYSVVRLTQIKGVGAAAIKACTNLLADYGLTFSTDPDFEDDVSEEMLSAETMSQWASYDNESQHYMDDEQKVDL